MPQRPSKKTETAERRAKVAKLYLQGKSQHAIALEVGINQGNVSRDLEAIRQQWLESSLVDFNAARARELAKIDLMEAEANDAWERSKLNREIQSVKKTTGDQGDKTETAMRKEEQTGNPEYLRVVEWCIDRRCKLLGLDAPLKVASTTPDGKQAAPGVMLLDLTRLTDEQLDQLDRMRNAANAPHSPTAEPAPTGGDPVEGSGGTGAVPAVA